jgi:hypothetical protein
VVQRGVARKVTSQQKPKWCKWALWGSVDQMSLACCGQWVGRSQITALMGLVKQGKSYIFYSRLRSGEEGLRGAMQWLDLLDTCKTPLQLLWRGWTRIETRSKSVDHWQTWTSPEAILWDTPHPRPCSLAPDYTEVTTWEHDLTQAHNSTWIYKQGLFHLHPWLFCNISTYLPVFFHSWFYM